TTRRRTLALLAAAGAIPGLAACGPDAPRGGGDDAEGGAVRVYWWGGDLRAGLTRDALDLFTESQEDVEVSPEYSEWTGYWDKLATQFAGGDAPDEIGRASCRERGGERGGRRTGEWTRDE